MKYRNFSSLRRDAHLALLALLFSAPALAAKQASPAQGQPPAVTTTAAPKTALPSANDAAAPLTRHLGAEAMITFGFLGLLFFSAGAGSFGKRSSYEVSYRKYPYGSFRDRRLADRDAA